MPDFDYDLVVLGGGSGGIRAGRMAASHGARVALVEEKELGGTCVNVGCVPKKLMAIGSHYRDDLHDMAGFGWTGGTPPTFDWSVFRRNKDAEIGRLNGIYAQVLDRAGVELVRGRGQITGPHTIAVGDRTLSGRHLLIAVGGRPWRPTPEELPGVEHTWTSDDIFHVDTLPPRMLVVGGGYIATEMASILHGFGIDAHLAYRGDGLLRGFDADVRHVLGNELRKRGMHLHFGCSPQRITRVDEGFDVQMGDGTRIETDAILMATGRVPNVAGLGLDAAGVHTSPRGAIEVDDRFQTNCPSIYAVGDVIDRVQLTPVALAEGMVVARNLFVADGEGSLDYKFVPTAVFTHPSVGTVGWTEADARRHFGALRVYKSTFRPMRHTMTGGNARTFMKILVDDATDQVVGMHMVGPDAAEIVQGFAVALRCGATKAQLDATIGIHPSAAEEFVTMRTEWAPTPNVG